MKASVARHRIRPRGGASIRALLVATLSAIFALPAGAAERIAPAADALPGLDRVGVASPARPAVAGTLGYGFTEAQGNQDAAHHRLSLRAAAALPVAPWFSLGASADGRYDQHQHDNGGVLSAALYARISATIPNWYFGADLIGILPGASEPKTSLRGASAEARALVAASIGGGLVAGFAGYRLDRSGKTGDNAATLSRADRLALGVSDFDAALVGLGVAVPVGQATLLGEVSADILVGRGAPAFRQSPLRVSAGVRRSLVRGLTLELLAVASLSAKPDLGATAPLVPNEPRFGFFGGLRYEILPPPPPPRPPSPPFVPKPAEAPLEVVVNDDQGAPIPGLRAFVIVNGEPRELACDRAGHCRIEHVPAGRAVIRVEAPGFEPTERPLDIVSQISAKLALRLNALPPPSQIRGVVRGFDGKALAAKIRIEPPGIEANVDPEGSFQVDVPPGQYDIVVEAEGYVSQRRHVQVEPQGVVILNADMVAKP